MKYVMYITIITIICLVRAYVFVTFQQQASELTCIAEGVIEDIRSNIKGLTINVRSYEGTSLVYTSHYPIFELGSTVSLIGECDEGKYFRPHIEVIVPPSRYVSFITNIRQGIISILRKSMHEPHSRLLSGIVFGIRQSLGEEFDEVFRKAGLSHIVVASGYNITVLMSLVTSVAFTFGKRFGLVLSAIAVTGYAFLVGMDPPILRALVMSFGLIIAMVTGRQYSGLQWLMITGAILVFIDPRLLVSMSMQLSFFATLGLLMFASFWERTLVFLSVMIRESAATTLSAGVFVMPILYLHTGNVSLNFLLANILVLPVLSILMILVVVGVLIGGVSTTIAWIVLLPVQVISKYIYLVASSVT